MNNIKTIAKRFVFLILALLCLFFLLVILCLPAFFSTANTYGRIYFCENQLKKIADAIVLYKTDYNGQWPSSLLEILPYYYKEEYKPGISRIPKCPGNRNEKEESDEWEYSYFPPKVNEIVPVCWDSKPHHIKSRFLPDSYIWNVLYSDGHIERLNEDGLFRALFGLAASNSDLMKMLHLPDKPTEKEKIRAFLAVAVFFTVAGFVVAIILFYQKKDGL
jgi:hypothetical protein